MGNNFWGALIAKLRQEQGVSQRTLASKTGVNRATLRRIENGNTSGDIETMERILRFLGHELEALESVSVERRIIMQATVEDNPNRRSRLALQALLALDLAN